jgi:hypothetical protein
MIIATEDSISEAVVRRLVSEFRPEVQIQASLGGKGKSYLERKASDLNRTATNIPVLLLVDLDAPRPCPSELISAWLPNGAAKNMLLRVAVMEIESWVLADRQNFASFLGINPVKIPTDTDSLTNPKEFVVNLARKSRIRGVRDDLVPVPGAVTSVGPGYNSRLLSYIRDKWEPSAARIASPSLGRLIDRLSSHSFNI